MRPATTGVGSVQRFGLVGVAGLGLATVVLASMSRPDRAGAVEPAAASPAGPNSTPSPGPGRSAAPIEPIGSSSCSARGCHGAVAPVKLARNDVYIPDGAYTTWLHFDPHARAYAVLGGPRSERMARLLARELGGKRATEAAQCLACHGPAGHSDRPDAAVAARDGVACESCHGPAGRWQAEHVSSGWKGWSPAQKAADGFADLATTVGRASSCVGCHVGDRSRGMDVNHDLIAAGHPRLDFEYAAYLASYPKHWREPHERPNADPTGAKRAEFEARSWAVGQLATARATLDLLDQRAADSVLDPPTGNGRAIAATWPELASSECFACHHDLDQPSSRPGGSGRTPWATWETVLVSPIAQALGDANFASEKTPWTLLRAEMDRKLPREAQVRTLIPPVRDALDALIGRAAAAPVDPNLVHQLLTRVGPAPERSSWDRTIQRYLALSALGRAVVAQHESLPPDLAESLRAATPSLNFAPKYDSPKAAHRPPDTH